MKLLRFVGNAVHGYLNFDLAFNDDLTFLIGINGSGKTTAVRAMTALLTPTVRALAHMKYGTLRVEFDHHNQFGFIESTRDDKEILLATSAGDDRVAIPVLMPEAYESPPRFDERERDYYREQEAVFAKSSVLSFVTSLPTPMFLDLERRVQGGARRSSIVRGVNYARPTSVNPFAGSLWESLSEAKTLADHHYRLAQAEQRTLTDRLKQDIILTAFQIGSGDTARPLPTKKDRGRSAKNQELVEGTLRTLGIPDEVIGEKVRPFFDHLRAILARLPDALTESPGGGPPDQALINVLSQWFAIEPQEKQIEGVVRLVRKYNAVTDGLLAPIQRYLQSVNQFLHDSGKQLRFGPTGDLGVAVARGDSEAINTLSSGERQLVVILTHLAFNPQARRANVLIIDEPELSLHLRWQELFVEAVQSASKGLQLILATHSPSIILDRADKCVDVQEARA